MRRKPSFAPPPDEEGGGAKRKPNNLPFLSLGALFKGRDGFLTDLRQRLAKPDGKAAAIVARQALYGLGGVGKSRAAIEYAWRYADDYSALLFVRAPSPSDLDGNPASPKVESSGGLRANLAALTGVLRIETEEKAVDRQVELVLRWLEEHHGWLLILDNVDTPESAQEAEALLARLRGGHVLITSRRADWSPSVEPLELHTLAEKDAVAFLAERTQTKRKKAPRDEADAAAIARELGGLALALEQAGAYIDKLRLSFAEYRVRWEASRSEVLSWYDPQVMQYPESVARTWQTTFDQ